MKFAKSNNPLGRSPQTDQQVRVLLDEPPEVLDDLAGTPGVVLMTRIRLARNLDRQPFPGWAKEAQRRAVMDQCVAALGALPQVRKPLVLPMDELSEIERLVLVERHLISRELSEAPAGAGVVLNRDRNCAVMINEEDHLRIAVLRPGLQLKRVWTTINALDTALEESLDFAFRPDLGYLTACPTNLGTGLRASAMMHLPALVITGQMEKVVRAVNQLGLVVRGLQGEGSDASGSIFQISNQTTLGESETDIIKRLGAVLETIVEQEINARGRLLESEPRKIFDKIGRAFGLLQHSHLVNSTEALNLLSLVRLGIDLGAFPTMPRPRIDQLFMLSQPGHLQYEARGPVEAAERDALRAGLLRREFANFPPPDFKQTGGN